MFDMFVMMEEMVCDMRIFRPQTEGPCSLRSLAESTISSGRDPLRSHQFQHSKGLLSRLSKSFEVNIVKLVDFFKI